MLTERDDDDDQEIPEFDLSDLRPSRHAARVVRDLVSDLIAEPEPRMLGEYELQVKKVNAVLEWAQGERDRLERESGLRTEAPAEGRQTRR
jgi:hypothetical protein